MNVGVMEETLGGWGFAMSQMLACNFENIIIIK